MANHSLLHLTETPLYNIVYDIINHTSGLKTLKDLSDKQVFNKVEPLHKIPKRFNIETDCTAAYVGLDLNVDGENVAVQTDEMRVFPFVEIYFEYYFGSSPIEDIDVQDEMYKLHWYVMRKCLREPTSDITTGIGAQYDSSGRLQWKFGSPRGQQIIQHSYFLDSIPYMGGETAIDNGSGFYCSKIRLQAIVNNAP